MFDALAEIAAKPLEACYALTGGYASAIALVTVLVMVLLLPLNLKSTKGMLEMQRLQPEMRRVQAEHRGDRQKLNEEMMKLYQEHKVNPLASCLPLLAQLPVFFAMFRLLRGLTRKGADGTFDPQFVSPDSALYKSLDGATEMNSLGLDLAITPAEAISDSTTRGVIYALIVVLLGVLYWFQQRMVASRAVSPTMSASQQKLLQYLPVAFAGFQIFFPTGLVFYYLTQAVLRIGQQAYITKRFYHGDHSLGRQAQAASVKAKELADDEKKKKGKSESDRSGDTAAPAKKGGKAVQGGAGKGGQGGQGGRSRTGSGSGSGSSGTSRTTPPKNRPTPSRKPGQRPAVSGKSRHPRPPKRKKS